MSAVVRTEEWPRRAETVARSTSFASRLAQLGQDVERSTICAQRQQIPGEAANLLNQRRLRSHLCLLPTFGVFLTLLVGRALARGDLVQGVPFRFHPNMRVA